MGKFKFVKGKKQKTGSDSPLQGKQNTAAIEENYSDETIPFGLLVQGDVEKKAQKSAFLNEKVDANAVQSGRSGNTQNCQSENVAESAKTSYRSAKSPAPEDEHETPSIIPGSEGEHKLQAKWRTQDRSLNFYDRQVLDYLAPKMKEFIARQEFLFVASADRNGECDCTSKFGKVGFIRVLSDKYLMYPEYRGNGVYANTGNITENPHIAMLIIDFTRDTVGLHINGKARFVDNEELRQFADNLPNDVIKEMNQEGKKCPERWMMIEVEEAYIQCSKHIPLMKKMDKKIDWGTDNIAAKGGDYFQLMDIPLYDRVGGDKAMEVAVDIFYRKVLADDMVSHVFADVDMESQRLKQKSFLSMAFGGPYKYTGRDLREVHKPLQEKYGLTDAHFDRVSALFRETLEELQISPKELQGMMEVIESTRDDILNR